MEYGANRDSFVYSGSTMEEGGNHGDFVITNPINRLPMTYKSDEEGEARLKSLPPGFHFRPLDVELVLCYLKRKVYNRPLPPNRIKEVQLYNYDPKTLTEMSNNKSFNGTMNEWYFFTPRDRKYPNGSRPSRGAGGGFWKATGAGQPVDYKGKLVGWKKTLFFCKGKQPHGQKTSWIMHEYVLENPPAKQRASNDDMTLDEWVLCRVYQNQKDAKRKADETPAREEAEAAIPASQIPPPQSDQQFHTPPQQTYPKPFYNNAFDNSTSAGHPALPESFNPILEPASPIFPQQAALPDYGSFIPSVGPMSSDDFHLMGHYNFYLHQQQQQQQQFSNFHYNFNIQQQPFSNCHYNFNIQQQQFSNFPDADQMLSDSGWGFGSS